MSERIEIVAGGGVPSDEELAAIVIALTPVASADADADGPTGPPAWRRAAILEGVGGRPATSAHDLYGRGPLELL